MAGDVAIFERHRARLSVAYRNPLGEWAAAAATVQEAWLRWHGVDSGKSAMLALGRPATPRLADVLPLRRRREPSPAGPCESRLNTRAFSKPMAALSTGRRRSISRSRSCMCWKLVSGRTCGIDLDDDYASKNGPIAALFPLTPCACSTRKGARFIGGGGSARNSVHDVALRLPRPGAYLGASYYDTRSCLISSRIRRGKVAGSISPGTTIPSFSIAGAIVIASSAIISKRAIAGGSE